VGRLIEQLLQQDGRARIGQPTTHCFASLPDPPVRSPAIGGMPLIRREIDA
jgi:hypothetical protein